MNRRKAFSLLAVLPLMSLSACGGGKPPATPDASSNEVRQFHEALQDGDVEIVRRLIGAKPYLVNARNEQGVSPLKAAQNQGNEELADLIRQKGGTE